jgi:TolB-like protein
MRSMICFVGFVLVTTAIQGADPQPFTSVTDSTSKVRVGPLVEETADKIVIRDLKEGIEFQAAKTSVKKIEKRIADDAAIRTAGLAPIVAYRVSELAIQAPPVGKVAQVSQNVVYINLGKDSGVYVGLKLDVFRKLEEIRDPDTKELLGVERPKIGVLELTEIQKGLSKGKVVSDTEIALKAGDEVEFQGGSTARIAVLPLQLEDGEQSDADQTIAEELVTELVQQKVTVLERSLLDRVVVEQAWQNTILFEPDKVQRLGQLTGATAVVTGKIAIKGKMQTIFVRLIDVRTGKILYAASTQTPVATVKNSTKPTIVESRPAGKPAEPAGSRPSTKTAEATEEERPAGKPAEVARGTVILGKTRTLPAGWTTKARFTSDKDKDGGIRLSGKSDLIVSRDGDFLKKDFTLEVVVTINDGDHISFIGLGDTSVVNSYGDPKLVAMLRIHAPHLKSGVVLTKNNATTDALGNLTRPGTHLFRITKEGSAVTFFVDVDNDGATDDDMELTIQDIKEYGPFLNSKNTFLFFGGTGQFKSVSLKLK